MTNPSFEKQDSTFERLRKPISHAFAILGGAIALFTVPNGSGSGWHEIIELIGFLLLIAAALGRIWCTIYIAGRKNKELCQLGPYSLCRNPLYLFSFLGTIGFGIALQNLILAAISGIIYLAYYRGVIRSEERRLAHIFGDAFTQYMNTVPRFWPLWRKPTSSEALTVSPKVLERGLREVVWFLFAIIGAEIINYIHENGHLVFLTLPF